MKASTGIKTYFPTPNSNLYLPSFISPPTEVYSNPLNSSSSSQSYQYQPVFYNSLNILTQSLNNSLSRVDTNQSSVRFANNNNSALCGYCLPTTAINSSQEVPSTALIPQHYENSAEFVKHRSLITHFNNYNIIEISTTTRNSSKEDIMVSWTKSKWTNKQKTRIFRFCASFMVSFSILLSTMLLSRCASTGTSKNLYKGKLFHIRNIHKRIENFLTDFQKYLLLIEHLLALNDKCFH